MADISIADIGVTTANAKALRAINKFGMNLADFAALTTSSSFTAFGNGTGYTVSNWISDGVFANLAAVQAAYPICQSTSDTVDWVLLQSAIDFMIYGSLGNTVYGSTKRRLLIPAGLYVCNRTLHIGYGGAGTPPANLNANRYVSITIEGEGPHPDASGNGMTGTTIDFNFTNGVGFAITGAQQVILRQMTIRGAYSYVRNNNPQNDADVWDRAAWKDAGLSTDNWLGGSAVNIGVAISPYSNSTSAAAYPARVLPSYFGGGTTTAQLSSIGGTDVLLEDVNIEEFVIGFGRPHGDSNDEFLRFHRGVIKNCPHSIVFGHSQNRNVSIKDCNLIGFHTAIGSRGGVTGTANLHGTYQNIHFGNGYQLIDHPSGDWSGPVTFRDCYAESFFRIGVFDHLILDTCFLSFLPFAYEHGSVHNHAYIGNCLVIRNTELRDRDGLFLDAEVGSVTMENITYGGSTVLSNDNAKLGPRYMNYVFSIMGHTNRTMIGNFNTAYGTGPFGLSGRDVSTDGVSGTYTHMDQLFVDYLCNFPNSGGYWDQGGTNAIGNIQRFPVPKIGRWQVTVTVASRSGLELTCSRFALGDCKADVGDVFAVKPTDADETLRDWNWFVVDSISGSNMLLRQLNNFDGATQFDYQVNGRAQLGTGTFSSQFHYICTRIRRNRALIVGDVTSGSNVITNVKFAYSNSGSGLDSASLNMVAGDYFLHQEVERMNTGSTTLKAMNLVSNVNTGAQTITLTDNFNITRTNYPIVFYVKVFNA